MNKTLPIVLSTDQSKEQQPQEPEQSPVLPDWLKGRLPEYERIDSIPQAFNDSTHNLWRLQNSNIDQKNHFLKVCSNTESPFWEIMHGLFGFELRKEIAGFSKTYRLIGNAISLDVPELIQVESLENNDVSDALDEACIVTSELEGEAVTVVDSDLVIGQFANHLVELHSMSRESHHLNLNKSWGTLKASQFNSLDWPLRLEATLKRSSKKWGGVIFQSDKYLKQALDACAVIKVTDFVLMMPDLRWDQFLQKDNIITALVDLDAFVFAPRELDFVILEYLLSVDQITIFSEEYSKHRDIPEIQQVRPAYRLLLFYMQILGETDLDDWMNKEAVF